MKNIHLLFLHDIGYRKGLVHELVEDGIVGFCVTDYLKVKGEKVPAYHEQIFPITAALGTRSHYEVMKGIEHLPVPGREILEALAPYESMALKLGMPQTCYPIECYEDEKRNYYAHVRYWNYHLDKWGINAIYMEDIPHTQGRYIIYALGKIKKIPILLAGGCSISGLRFFGNSIKEVGHEIQEYYLTLNNRDYELFGNAGEYYKNHTGRLNDIKQKMDPGKDSFSKMKAKQTDIFLHQGYRGIKGIFRPEYLMLKEFIYRCIKKENEEQKKHRRDVYHSELKLSIAARSYRMHDAVTVKGYNRMAQEADYSLPYIYFALQQTPEETTIPRAGVFAEQYHTIYLLAKAAEKLKVWVYVKEHYVQPTRQRYIYEDLSRIPNVKLIKTTESTYDVISHSMAVATQTGTCILEGICMGKPAFVFGDCYIWKGMPGLFTVSEQEEVSEIIKKIQDGYKVDASEVKKYFYAVQKVAIPYDYQVHFDAIRWGSISDEEYEPTKIALKEKIKEWCKSL